MGVLFFSSSRRESSAWYHPRSFPSEFFVFRFFLFYATLFFFRVLFHARIQVTKWSIATDGQLLSRLSIPMIFHGDSSSPAWQKKSLLQDFIFYFFIIFSYWWYREQRHKEQLLCQGQTKKLWWWYQSFRQTRKLFPAFIFLKIRMMSLRRTKFKKTRTSSSNRIIKEKRGNLMIEWFLSCQNSLQNSNVFPKKIKKKKKLFY